MTRSAPALAYEHLHQGIARGDYPPGSWLREDEVALAAGVSRTPVREALHRLQSEGLVEMHPRRGAVVVGWTARDIDDLYDLRVLLECYGVRRVAARSEALDVPALEAMCVEMETELESGSEDADRGHLGALCIEFHMALQRATGNRKLLTLLPSVLTPPFVREAFHHHTAADLQRAFAQHREMLEAIHHGDPDWASGIMLAHLRAGRYSLREMERALPVDPGLLAGSVSLEEQSG